MAILLVLAAFLGVSLGGCGTGAGVNVKGGSKSPPKWKIFLPI
ncbi:MAG: hypothetical protein QF654_06315 [Alphaproteobacteria bacterium]|jgi:hypothetical protein|nr:hypothetical protein [Alphaproteobacteria bacterium]